MFKKKCSSLNIPKSFIIYLRSLPEKQTKHHKKYVPLADTMSNKEQHRDSFTNKRKK